MLNNQIIDNLLTLDELLEARYFNDEQKEFLKDYQFRYILYGYQDTSMQTDDDCGHTLVKIAVVKNNGCGDIADIGTINIEITTFCPIGEELTLFEGEEKVEYHISSDNISGFPSYTNMATENLFNDKRKEVFDKLGILDDAMEWYAEKYSTDEVDSEDDVVAEYLEERFSKHIYCDKCHSLIHSSHWVNFGLFQEHKVNEGIGYPFEAEREYFAMQCPIRKEITEVDADEHPELYSTLTSSKVESRGDVESLEELFSSTNSVDGISDKTKSFGGLMLGASQRNRVFSETSI